VANIGPTRNYSWEGIVQVSIDNGDSPNECRFDRPEMRRCSSIYDMALRRLLSSDLQENLRVNNAYGLGIGLSWDEGDVTDVFPVSSHHRSSYRDATAPP
jgi:hypothetical protein